MLKGNFLKVLQSSKTIIATESIQTTKYTFLGDSKQKQALYIFSFYFILSSFLLTTYLAVNIKVAQFLKSNSIEMSIFDWM